MSAIDWVGLWAALQVVGIVLGVALLVFVVIAAVASVFVIEPLRRHFRRRR